MNQITIQERSMQFSVQIIIFYKKKKTEYPDISKQILRSGTAIGANLAEAKNAQSKKDFIHKISIAIKEARETEYWLTLFAQVDSVEKSLLDSINEICAILTTTLKTLKQNKNS